MPTLKEFQVQMEGDDETAALAAANGLTDYYGIYNDEYNTLILKRMEALQAIEAEYNSPHGVDHSVILHLRALVQSIESRMLVQDARMIAFRASSLAINPPTQDQVEKVKSLTTQLAVQVARDQALQEVMTALGEMAGLVNQIQAG